MHHSIKIKMCCLVILIVMTAAGAVFSVAPNPELLEKIQNGKADFPAAMKNSSEQNPYGLNAPSKMNILSGIKNEDGKTNSDKALAPVDFNILAVLVTFTDNPYSTPSVRYDSVMYSNSGKTVRNYYDEISYGQLDIVTVNLPSSTGWQTAPQSYDYYVNNESGISGSSYPHNSQKLVEDLIPLIDPLVNFGNYDNNNDGYVDAMVVIHAGPGAEVTGDSTDFWSHKWNTRVPKATNEGVYVWEYTLQPEYVNSPGDLTIGVICHELGHAFGLPDLYDVDGSSYGIGRWGIMSYGSWNGPNGSTPAHPCAWSRIQMGFASATDITSNVTNRAIRDVKANGEILHLSIDGSSSEYFLIENRQKSDFDTYIPGSGLLIWHIDDAKATSDNTDNSQEWYPGLPTGNHLRVALEQADGLFEIEHHNDLGDNSDVFINGRDFNGVSPTNSDSYSSGASFVSVTDISNPSSIMYADLTVGLAAAIEDDNNQNEILPESVELQQNYPNPFNPSTTIDFSTSIGGQAQLTVYNILGQKVKALLNETVPAGDYSVEWQGDSDNGGKVVSGLYFYKLSIDEFTKIRKMVLLK